MVTKKHKPTKVKGKRVKATPRPKPTRSRSKMPATWKQVMSMAGLNKIADHSGDSYGQRGPPGSSKRRTYNKKRARGVAKNVPKKKRAKVIKRKQPKKRSKRRAVGTAKRRR